MSRRPPPALPPQPEDPVPVEHDSSDGDGGAWMLDAWTASPLFSSMSRRPPPALPPQSEDPVPVEHDDSDGDGGTWMLDALPALLNLIYTSPPRLLPPPSAWDTMMVSAEHLTPSPPRSPSPLWNFHGEQRLMGPTANCSAAVLEKVFGTKNLLAKCVIFVALQYKSMLAVELPATTRVLEKAVEQASATRVLEKVFNSYGLEKHMNTETGGSSLAVIESYDYDNELGDNYAEQTEISRKRPRNPQFTKRSSTQDHLERNENKAELIRQSSRHWRSPLRSVECALTHGDTSRKRLKGTKRTKSAVWLYFTKLPSANPDKDTAECNLCKKIYKCGSKKDGTSSLRRHLKKDHQIDLTLSEAWKEPQRSSCSQKLQSTGSAACAGIPTPLTENNRNDLLDKDFELGDTSRKRLKCTSSSGYLKDKI